jgi:hypothetical protein
VARSFHCTAAQEMPSLRARMRFPQLPALAARLPAPVLARVTTLWLDTFPDEPAQWASLGVLPALRALVRFARLVDFGSALLV